MPPDILPGRATRKSEWPNRIISALLGIVVSVVGAVILGRLQAREPHLVYWLTEALPFSGQSVNVSIYQISVSNDGKQEIFQSSDGISSARAGEIISQGLKRNSRTAKHWLTAENRRITNDNSRSHLFDSLFLSLAHFREFHPVNSIA